MRFDLVPYGKPFELLLGIQVLRAVNLRLTVFDSENRRIYSERKLKFLRNGTVRLKLPIVPDKLTVEIVDTNLAKAGKVFRIADIKVLPDTQCPLDLTEQDKKFIRFIKWFACECSRLEAGSKGTIYQSDGFSILYCDEFREDGKELTTPARIDKETAIFELSQSRTADYTVPMLIVLLLHEYGHKFKNKEYGKEESNELSADLIACHIALNLGFDSHEVKHCFEEVFRRKNTKLNKLRMAAINEFIAIFEKNEGKRCKRNVA